MTELRQVTCPCGCGAIVGHPMEVVNGKYVVRPIPPESLRLLESGHYPKTCSGVRNGDTRLVPHG
jgi:hypothetical protein